MEGDGMEQRSVTFAEPLVTIIRYLPPDNGERSSPWEQVARDQARFARRIQQIENILTPVLTASHREHHRSRQYGSDQ